MPGGSNRQLDGANVVAWRRTAILAGPLSRICDQSSVVASLPPIAPSPSHPSIGYGLRPSRQRPGHDWRDGDGDLSVPVQKASAHARVYDDAGSACVSRYRHRPYCLLWDGKHKHPRTCLTPLNTSPAPSPVNASRLPSRTTRASLGAGTVRYSFTVTDFHRLPSAGLPAHRPTHDPLRTSWALLLCPRDNCKDRACR